MKTLRVHHPGAFSTIQDAGRPGLRRFGIPVSGAMDQFSFRIGNLLVGNKPDEAAIEVTMMGLIMEAAAPLTVAITGADLGAHLNGEPAPQWTSLTLKPGDRINFKHRVNGCRAYLAVRGGVDGPAFLGSRSTFTRGRMGAPLQTNDVLTIGDRSKDTSHRRRSLSPHFWPSFTGTQHIRVILGPQHDYFTPRGLETFLASTYRLSPRSDRQGLRTDGPPIEIAKGPDIITDPTPMGAIQVPGDGKPIILHRDGQSTGGYAKIAVVASVDMDCLGRMAPGDAMTFQAITVAEARALAVEEQRRMTLFAAALMRA